MMALVCILDDNIDSLTIVRCCLRMKRVAIRMSLMLTFSYYMNTTAMTLALILGYRTSLFLFITEFYAINFPLFFLRVFLCVPYVLTFSVQYCKTTSACILAHKNRYLVCFSDCTAIFAAGA
jgi:hypothetical protein